MSWIASGSSSGSGGSRLFGGRGLFAGHSPRAQGQAAQRGQRRAARFLWRVRTRRRCGAGNSCKMSPGDRTGTSGSSAKTGSVRRTGAGPNCRSTSRARSLSTTPFPGRAPARTSRRTASGNCSRRTTIT
ncbi:MAG: hypothetical protein WED34_14800 [Planctomycetales bacterium]